MPRNIGWNEPVKRNVLNLVEALLLLADGESELDDEQLKAGLEVEWISENELRVTGKTKQKRSKREQRVEVGTRKEYLVQLVKKAGKSLELPKPKEESGSSKEDREAEAVQVVIDCLKELGVLEEDPKNTRKNQGYRKFILTLKHQTASTEENLGEIKRKWSDRTQSNVPEALPTTPTPTTNYGINWHDVCQKMLEDQREKQKFRRQITGRGLGHEVNVYVQLGLVKPKQQPRRKEDSSQSAERGMLQYQLTQEEVEKEYTYKEFFQQIIEGQNKNFTITGEPGAGKTTWLNEIARHLDNSKKSFPICISLESLGRKTIEQYLLENWLKEAQRFIPPDALKVTAPLDKELENLFNSGKVWLLLDGVDEMRVDDSEFPLKKIVDYLTGWVASARVVLTCRLNVWEVYPNALPNFDTYRTLHFDDEQVWDFIQQWFTKTDKPELGKQLKDKLDESGKERIRDLIKNPLRLAMLCGTWYVKQGDLPNTKAMLYKRFRDYFYDWMPHPLLTKDLDKQKELHASLSKLALEAIKRKLPIRKSFAYDQMKSMFHLACEIGWLNWVYKDADSDEDVYAFFHLSFQEYFAALEIPHWDFFLKHDNQNPQPLPGNVYCIFEKQWKEVILLWFGREDVENEEKEEFIKALVEFEDGCKGFYWYRAYFLAAAAIAEFRCSRADEIVSQIVQWQFGYFDTEEQRWTDFFDAIKEGAREALYYTKRINAVDALLDWLNLRQPSIELTPFIEAIYELGYLGQQNPKAIAALVELLKNGEDEYIRRYAAESLGKISPRNPKAVLALLELIKTSANEENRMQAACNLAYLDPGNLTSIHTLIKIIQKSQDENIRMRTAESLDKIDKGNPKVIDSLVELIQTSQNEEILQQAARIIGEIGKGNPKAVSVMIELIDKSHDEDTRIIAVDTLGEVGECDPEAITAFVKLIQNSKDRYIQNKALYQLGKLGKTNSKTVDVIAEFIQKSSDENEDTRMQVVESLGERGKDNPIVIAALKELIQNSQDEFTRWRAADSLLLVNENDPLALATLVELTQQTANDNTRWHSARSLWLIDKNNPIALATFLSLLQTSQDEYILFLAARSLSKIYQKQFLQVEVLLKLLRYSNNYYIFWEELEKLKNILEKYLMPHVVNVLKDCLSEDIYIYDFGRYEYCYDLIWHCAQTLPYPEFYQAWHHPNITSI